MIKESKNHLKLVIIVFKSNNKEVIKQIKKVFRLEIIQFK